MSRILFWTGFGLFTRLWQLGIEMRPFFSWQTALPYPVYGAVGASFGYWLDGVDKKQTAALQERKAIILEKRARWKQSQEAASASGVEETPVIAA